jgi:hypothetical protein
MNGKILRMFAVGLTVGSLLSEIAPAQVVTIDPNSFASGQVINTPGVTLETETLLEVTTANGYPQYAETFSAVYAASCGVSYPCSSTTYPSPLGPNVFAPSPTGALPGMDANGSSGFWGDDNIGGSAQLHCSQNCLLSGVNPSATGLMVNFAQPTNYVDVLASNSGEDPTEVIAFNSAGVIVGSAFDDGTPSGGGGNDLSYGVGNISITTAGAQISTVLIGGSLSYQTVGQISYAAPEIDPTSAASGLTLLLGGVMVLRGRRAQPPPRYDKPPVLPLYCGVEGVTREALTRRCFFSQKLRNRISPPGLPP